MDLAYPIRGGRKSGPDPLKWSLRSLWHHFTPGAIYIAGGEPPEWLDLDQVKWITVPLEEHKREHTGRILEAILRTGISEEFLWMNDDFFLLEDRDDFPVWGSRRSLSDQINSLPDPKYGGDKWNYREGLRGQLELLEAWGHTDPLSLDLHVPLPLRRELISEIYARARAEAPDLPRGFFRSLYQASGLPVEQLTDDAKIYPHNEEIPAGCGIVSTSPVSWNVGAVGKEIRKRYWREAPWELQKHKGR